MRGLSERTEVGCRHLVFMEFEARWMMKREILVLGRGDLGSYRNRLGGDVLPLA